MIALFFKEMSLCFLMEAKISSATFGLQFLIFGFLFLAPVGVGIFGMFKQKKRHQIFRLFAQQNGWNFPNGDSDLYRFDDQENYRLFKLGNGLADELYSVAHRQYQNSTLFLFDYYFERGSYKYSVNVNTTGLCIRYEQFNLPFFSLYQESTWSKVGEFFGTHDIDFPTHPNFSARYKLTGENEALIRQFFTPQLLSYLEMIPNINIDAGGDKMFIYTLGNLEPIENFNNFVNEKIHIFNNICQCVYR